MPIGFKTSRAQTRAAAPARVYGNACDQLYAPEIPNQIQCTMSRDVPRE